MASSTEDVSMDDASNDISNDASNEASNDENSESYESRSSDNVSEDDDAYLSTTTVHGRQYQDYAIQNAVHFMPADEEMGEFLGIQHVLLKGFSGNKIIYPEVKRLRRVLDLGYGAADWAIKIAKDYPEAEVAGIDIACHMLPESIPGNFIFERGNMNEELPYRRNYYDLVQARFIADGISSSRWSSLIEEIACTMAPGGWCQLIEYYPMIQSDSGSITEDHALRRWSKRYMRSIDRSKNPRIAMSFRTKLDKVNLTNVQTGMFPIPLSPWPEGKKGKLIGEQMQTIIGEYLRSMSLLPFIKNTLMSIEEFDQLIADAASEARDVRLKAYLPLYICIAQKPMAGWSLKKPGLNRPKQKKAWPWVLKNTPRVREAMFN